VVTKVVVKVVAKVVAISVATACVMSVARHLSLTTVNYKLPQQMALVVRPFVNLILHQREDI